MAERPGGHGERGGNCCDGPLIGEGGGGLRSDGFGTGTGRPFLPYLSA
jgi:hypothetical protein